MTAQLSPEQVRSLLAGTSSGEGEQESMTAGGPRRVYRVVWDRCAVCKERHQGLWPHRAPGPHPRIEYVCGWCWKKLSAEREEVDLDGRDDQECSADELGGCAGQVRDLSPDRLESGGQRAFSFAGLLPDD